MMKIDTICRRLRNVGIFLLGVAAVCLAAHYIYTEAYSPERRTNRAIEELFAQGMEKALAQQAKKK
jgi:hypothetical protein